MGVELNFEGKKSRVWGVLFLMFFELETHIYTLFKIKLIRFYL